MEERTFDTLTRTLATGTTRRRVLGLLTGGLAVAFGGGKAALAEDNAGGNSACAALCQELYPPGADRGACIAAGAHGEGPCAETTPPPVMCGSVDCQLQLGDNDCTTTECLVVEIFGVPTPQCYNNIYELHGQPCTQGGAGMCSVGTCVH
jgi:hypothetical protein